MSAPTPMDTASAPAPAPVATATATAAAPAAAAVSTTPTLNEAALMAKWTQTRIRLDASWDEIGWNTAERRAAILSYGEQLSALANKFVALAQCDKKAFQERIHATRNSIVDYCKRVNKIFLSDEYTKLDTTLSLRAQEQFIAGKLKEILVIANEHESRIKSALGELHPLWTRLGTAYENGFEGVVHDISEQKVAAIQAKITDANAEIVRRTGVVTALIKDCNDLIKELAFTPQELTAPIDAKIMQNDVAGLGVSSAGIAELESKLGFFRQTKATRQQRVGALAVEITALWVRLRIPQTERATFLGRHSGLTSATIKACEVELERLKAVKKATLHELIAEVKAKLISLWKDAFVHPTEQQKFKPAFTEGGFTDESLESFEAEIARVESRLQKMSPLLSLIKERNAVLDEKNDLDALVAADASLKYKHGYSLKVESFAKKMPKLNKKLKALIPAWELENGPLIVNGVSYLQSLIASEDGKKSEQKENVPSAAAAPAAAAGTGASKKAAGDKTPQKPVKTKSVTTPSSSMKRPASAQKSHAHPTPVSSKKAKPTPAAAGTAAAAAGGDRPVLGEKLNFDS